MKKSIFIIKLIISAFIMLALILLTGCASKDENRNNENKSSTETQTATGEKMIEKKKDKLADVVKVGDYVNYIPKRSVSVVSDVADNGYKKQTIKERATQWRVLNIENGKVTLIGKPAYSSERLGMSGKDLKTASETIKVINEPTRICKELYSSDIGKARSINIEDINKLLKIDLSDSRVKSSPLTKPGEKTTYDGVELPNYYYYDVMEFITEGSIEFELLNYTKSYFVDQAQYYHEMLQVGMYEDEVEEREYVAGLLFYIYNGKNSKSRMVRQSYFNQGGSTEAYIIPVVELDEDVFVSSENTGDGSSRKNGWRIYSGVSLNNYDDFINKRAYYADMCADEYAENTIDAKYAIKDINNDGIDELLVACDQRDGFYYTYIYTKDEEAKISLAGAVYSWTEIRYSDNNIVYLPVRTSEGTFCMAGTLENGTIVEKESNQNKYTDLMEFEWENLQGGA